jgi:hypothetical protein
MMQDLRQKPNLWDEQVTLEGAKRKAWQEAKELAFSRLTDKISQLRELMTRQKEVNERLKALLEQAKNA